MLFTNYSLLKASLPIIDIQFLVSILLRGNTYNRTLEIVFDENKL